MLGPVSHTPRYPAENMTVTGEILYTGATAVQASLISTCGRPLPHSRSACQEDISLRWRDPAVLTLRKALLCPA